jgi:hypothetical protein
MNASTRGLLSLPPNMRGFVIAKLASGEHRGESQLQARHVHRKIVVDKREMRALESPPVAGETWKLKPLRAHGRVIFCKPIKREALAEGVHPVVARLREFQREGGCVTVSLNGHGRSRHRRRFQEVEQGPGSIVLVFNRDDRLRMFEQNMRWGDAPGGQYVGTGVTDDGPATLVFYPKRRRA